MSKRNRRMKDSLDRADFLDRNRGELIRLMADSGVPDPVGVIVDVRDFHGRQFALALEKSDAEIDADIAKYQGKMIPTLITILTWEQVRKLLPYTSPTATTNLNAAWRIRSVTGQALAIAITAKGNRYELVSLPEDAVKVTAGLSPTEPIRDGQIRHRSMK